MDIRTPARNSVPFPSSPSVTDIARSGTPPATDTTRSGTPFPSSPSVTDTARSGTLPPPPEFARMLTEAAAQLAPDPLAAAERINLQNLIDQTAAMNIQAARTSAAFNPAIIGYASHLANQVSLESNIPLHRPLRQSFGDRFGERDRSDGHVRVPPVNETRSGPAVL